MPNNEEIAKEVIAAVGGKENTRSVAHCATRLRIMVNDENKVEGIEKLKGAFCNFCLFTSSCCLVYI